VCSDPAAISHGSVTVDEQVAVYSCDVGYTMVGSGQLTCSSMGLGWLGSPPTCSMSRYYSACANAVTAVSFQNYIYYFSFHSIDKFLFIRIGLILNCNHFETARRVSLILCLQRHVAS